VLVHAGDQHPDVADEAIDVAYGARERQEAAGHVGDRRLRRVTGRRAAAREQVTLIVVVAKRALAHGIGPVTDVGASTAERRRYRSDVQIPYGRELELALRAHAACGSADRG